MKVKLKLNAEERALLKTAFPQYTGKPSAVLGHLVPLFHPDDFTNNGFEQKLAGKNLSPEQINKLRSIIYPEVLRTVGSPTALDAQERKTAKGSAPPDETFMRYERRMKALNEDQMKLAVMNYEAGKQLADAQAYVGIMTSFTKIGFAVVEGVTSVTQEGAKLCQDIANRSSGVAAAYRRDRQKMVEDRDLGLSA